MALTLIDYCFFPSVRAYLVDEYCLPIETESNRNIINIKKFYKFILVSM